MGRSLILCSIFALIAFTSCKKTGSRKACFTLSKENPKVNDTLYLLNCSENYSKFMWFSNNGFYPTGYQIDSLSRHQMIVPSTSGPLIIALRVGDNNFYSNSYSNATELVKTITVAP